MSNEIEERIVLALKGNQKFDADVREVMERALKVEESKAEVERLFPIAHHTQVDALALSKHTGYLAIAHLAIDVAVSLANAFAALRRPTDARTFRVQLDMVVGLNGNVFWTQHAPSLMPLWHAALMDHLDSISMQMERGETKIGPYDKLIMGAEASVMAPFSQILFLVGGLATQMEKSVAMKKELMPLLMK